MPAREAPSEAGGAARGVTLSRPAALLALGGIALALAGAALLAHSLAARCPPAPAAPRAVPPVPPAPADVRLPRHVVPLAYRLEVTPFLAEGNFTFVGAVSIALEARTDTSRVTFHAAGLALQRVALLTADGRALRVRRRHEDARRQLHALALDEPLRARRRYVLNISYSGVLGDDLRGFYRTSYEEGGTRRWAAVTQFQATDARRAFPCWDEPALKARFSVRVARPRHMTALSNMNLLRTTDHEQLPEYQWDEFAESLPMSTYLVAWAVTDFGVARLGDANGTNGTDGANGTHGTNGTHSAVQFAVWARREALPGAQYALSVGPRVLRFLEDYYGIPFPLPKIDMLALPDFKAGAMENWGLLTFREVALLYSPGQSPSAARARVAAVVAHEIAHQWFGNLVTPAWWSDIWLNEGFASYVEYVAVDAVEPSWQLMQVFALNEVQSVFKLDALASSHQISVEVADPEEIGAIFDKISYGKGSAVLRMMQHFLSAPVFRAGVTDYLTAQRYGAASQRDLWNALSGAARARGALDVDVAVVMDSWTLQIGFPVVTVTRDYASRRITFEQERFTLSNVSAAAGGGPLWWVPVSYTNAGECDFEATQPRLWLRAEQRRTQLEPALAPDDWLLVNVQQTGFYRVQYDTRNWRLLTAELLDAARFERVHAANRAQLLDDALSLALTGWLPYAAALDLTLYLAHERSYAPWKAGLVALGYIDTMLSRGAHYLEYKAYVLRLLTGAVRELGWQPARGESVLRAQLRADLHAAACHLQRRACLRRAARLFAAWMRAPDPARHVQPPADVRAALYCAALQAGGAREWEFAWQRLRAAREPSERELLLSVLGCTRAPHLLYRYLELALHNDSGVRKQDAVRVFGAVAGSAWGQPVAYGFVRANWQRLEDFAGSAATLSAILKTVTHRLTLPHEYAELQRFVAESCGALGRPAQQVLERTAANVQWMQRNYDTIVAWLLANAPPDAIADDADDDEDDSEPA